ncbi:calcium-dependent phosphotriesterase [Dacryopinax primogenitus]|uniref:Calcium-dependent phosphotriesterase n=1 Tax=Dacryopinax primogenitus (strain DJM 731) TaxID=1858805 RepID=M5G444_DACPD|nr:calcium-dependent phosphotriesterase [Dacryopinax primogenitus]EJT98527.1 calcium-dependent phosphotriesterase [Dacryopinax primogenitus]
MTLGNVIHRYFNPQNLTPPFFQIFDEGFFTILGDSPSIRLITENDSYAFAHEAPVYLPEKNELWFSSNDGGPLGMSNRFTDNKIWKINLDEAEAGNATLYEVPITPPLEMTNGGTLYANGQPLFIQSGRAELPPTLAIVNPSPPYNSTVILDNFYGRQFNSLNDVKVHPVSKAIFFTDVTYGWLLYFRPMPALPNQVYRFDPASGAVRVVADGFDRCNGIAFSTDGSRAYVSNNAIDRYRTVLIRAKMFDVDPLTQRFLNRRVFAYADTGIPDGIQLDALGNIYSGTGDGVQIWNPAGFIVNSRR